MNVFDLILEDKYQHLLFKNIEKMAQVGVAQPPMTKIQVS